MKKKRARQHQFLDILGTDDQAKKDNALSRLIDHV